MRTLIFRHLYFSGLLQKSKNNTNYDRCERTRSIAYTVYSCILNNSFVIRKVDRIIISQSHIFLLIKSFTNPTTPLFEVPAPIRGLRQLPVQTPIVQDYCAIRWKLSISGRRATLAKQQGQPGSPLARTAVKTWRILCAPSAPSLAVFTPRQQTIIGRHCGVTLQGKTRGSRQLIDLFEVTYSAFRVLLIQPSIKLRVAIAGILPAIIEGPINDQQGARHSPQPQFQK